MNRVLLGVLFAAATCGCAFAQQAPFTLSIKGVHKDQAPREIGIKIAIKGTSNQAICASSSTPVLDFTFDIQNTYGHPVLETPLLYKIKHPEPDPYALVSAGGGCVHAGGSIVRDIPISDFYGMSEPGTYTVEVSRQLKDMSPDWVTSNTITIRVDDDGWRELPK
jgi:hypothetical protein